MLKKLSLLLLVLLGLGTANVNAQTFDPCEPALVADVQAQLITAGYSCLEGAGPFVCLDEVIAYADANCPMPIDTTWVPNDSTFCDPLVVADLQNQLVDQGYTCLVGAGPFACVEDVFNYAEANCPMPIDTTWVPNDSTFCDPLVVADLQTQLIDAGYDCLVGAGPFACVGDVFDFAELNCPMPIDTNWVDDCDPANVAALQADLIAQGYDCLEGVGPFACVSDVFNYLNTTNCWIDTTWVDDCDPANVAVLQADLIAQGYDCLEGVGPFACVSDVFNYLNDTECWGDSTWVDNCDPAVVAALQADLVAQGFDCLDGAGPFACVSEVIDYLGANCPGGDSTWVDSCDPAVVADLQNQLIAEGYDCLEGAGPFACENDVICYAMNNCQPPVDSTWIELPECLQNIPTTVTTFQQFLQYIVANCDSVLVPACFLSAPQFDTDEEFLQWIAENCPEDFNQITPTGGSAELVNVYSVTRAVSATKQPLTQAATVTLTPNPTTSAFTVQLSGNTNMERVELLDLNGRVVLVNQNVQANTTRIALDGLPQGLYVVKVFDQNGRVSTQKGVKQ